MHTMTKMFAMYGGRAWTDTLMQNGRPLHTFHAAIELGKDRQFALHIVTHENWGFFVEGPEGGRFVAPLFGTALKARFVWDKNSPWVGMGISAGFDYSVNPDKFHEMVERYTGLWRPEASLVIENGLAVNERVSPQPDATGFNIRGKRKFESIDRITLHHTVSGEMPAIGQVNNWWRGRGKNGTDWDRAGYHFLIRADGSIWQLTRLNTPSWGAGAAANPRSIHIAFAGNFSRGCSPSPSARDAFRFLVRGLLRAKELPNLHDAKHHVVGHREWAATACPGIPRMQYLSWV